MKFKILLLALFSFASAQAAHVSDRAIYQTDVKTASGTPVWYFPLTLPAASRVMVTNSDQEVVSSSITASTLAYLDATSSIQTQLNSKQDTLAGSGVTPGSYTSANITVDSRGIVTAAANGSGGGISGGGVSGRVPVWSSTSALTSSPALTFDVTKNALATGDSSQSLGLDTFAANNSSIAGALIDSFAVVVNGCVSLSPNQIVFSGDKTSIVPEGSIIKFTNNGSLTYTVASSSVFDSVNTTVNVYDSFNAFYYGCGVNPVTSVLSTPASKSNSVAMIGGLAYGQNSLAIGALSESLGERSIAIGERNKVNQLVYNIGTTHAPIAISPTTFTFSGDVTDDLFVGYYVRISFSGEYQRVKIVSSVFSGTDTVVTFDQTINHNNQSYFYFSIARVQGYHLNNSGVAIGQINNITGDSSVGIGKNNRIDNANSYALGEQLTSSYNNAYLFGKGINADQSDAVFIGSNAGSLLKITSSNSSFSGPLTASAFNGPTNGYHTGNVNLNGTTMTNGSIDVTDAAISNPLYLGNIGGGYIQFGQSGSSGNMFADSTSMTLNSVGDVFLNANGGGAVYVGSNGTANLFVGTLSLHSPDLVSIDVLNRSLVESDGTSLFADYSGNSFNTSAILSHDLPNTLFHINSNTQITGTLDVSDTLSVVNSTSLANGNVIVDSSGINVNTGAAVINTDGSASFAGGVNISSSGVVSGDGLGLTNVNGRSSALPSYMYFQGNVTSIISNQIVSYGKADTATTIIGMQGVATGFTCISNPVFTLYDCGTSAGACTSGRTTLASVTLTAANTGTDGSVSSSALAAGHYWAIEITGGTCTALTANGNVQFN